MPTYGELRKVDNRVEWYNGLKWLVKETLPTEKKATDKLEELNERKNVKG